MPRLIDADALEAYIKDYACIPCKEYGADKDGIRCDFCGFGFCLEGIKRHTAHDAEPVKHGHWCVTQAYPHTVYCSECFQRFAQAHWAVWEDGSLPRDYCPHCGAKMDW